MKSRYTPKKTSWPIPVAILYIYFAAMCGLSARESVWQRISRRQIRTVTRGMHMIIDQSDDSDPLAMHFKICSFFLRSTLQI